MAHYTKLDDFKTAVTTIFEDVLPRVKKTGITEMFHYSLRVKDIVFKERDFVGELLNWFFKNSKDNRRPSVKPNSKKLPRKMGYLIRIICKVSDINFLPAGVMADSPCLEAEDRGHIATLFWCYRGVKFEVALWKKVAAYINSFRQNKALTNEYFNEVAIRLDELIDKKIPFSLDELIPQTIMQNWENSTIPIAIKVYPNREKHVQEIISFNGTEDTWTVHQRALRHSASFLRVNKKDPETLFDGVFSYVDGNDFFIGNDPIFFASHAAQTEKAENAEEEILWLWLSAVKMVDNDKSMDTVEKRSKAVYKKFQTTMEDKRIAQYQNLLSIGAFQTPKKVWQDEFLFINAVANSAAYVDFDKKLKDIVSKAQKRGENVTNLKDLRVTKVDAALMFCWVIKWYIDARKLNPTIANTEKYSWTVFNEALEMINDDTIVSTLQKKKASHGGRSDNFFNILINRLQPDEDAETIDVRQELIDEARRNLKKTKLNPDVPFMVLDRKRAGEFIIAEVNLLTGKGFDKGHKDPSFAGDDVTNFFLQFSHDNRGWGDSRSFDPVEYGVEYLRELKGWVSKDDDEQYEAYLNTKIFIESCWK